MRMSKKFYFFFLLILVLINTVVFADPQEEESWKKYNLYKKWGGAFTLYAFSESNFKTVDLGFSNITISRDPYRPAIVLDLKKKFLDTGVKFSFYLNDGYLLGSPAYDGILMPRQSLNKCPITGWYEWDK